MRKVLYFLGQLDDLDIDWLARHGRREILQARSILIRQGQPTPDMFIVIDGAFDVTVDGVGSVARLMSGEMIGEMSFVDSAPPSATVTAVTESVVLAVAKESLKDHFEGDPLFGYRFYKALSLFLADRLRAATRAGGRGGRANPATADAQADELDENLLDAVSIAGDRFSRLTKAMNID